MRKVLLRAAVVARVGIEATKRRCVLIGLVPQVPDPPEQLSSHFFARGVLWSSVLLVLDRRTRPRIVSTDTRTIYQARPSCCDTTPQNKQHHAPKLANVGNRAGVGNHALAGSLEDLGDKLVLQINSARDSRHRVEVHTSLLPDVRGVATGLCPSTSIL